MINNKWMDDPVLSGISNEKLDILTKIVNGSKDMNGKEMLTYFVKESNLAEKNGIHFSDTETDAILKVLMTDMTPEEIKRVNMVKKLAKMMSKK